MQYRVGRNSQVRGKLENRLDNEVSSKAELAALKAQIQEILNAQRATQEQEKQQRQIKKKIHSQKPSV